MLTYDTRLRQVVTQLVNERISTVADGVLEGNMAENRYHRACGEIFAYRQIDDLFDQAVAIIEGKTTQTD